jgi:hypothetical protein
MNRPHHEVLAAALVAYSYRPQRLEATVLVMNLLINQGSDYAAWAIGKSVEHMERCTDQLFIETEYYNEYYPNLMFKLNEQFLPKVC